MRIYMFVSACACSPFLSDILTRPQYFFISFTLLLYCYVLWCCTLATGQPMTLIKMMNWIELIPLHYQSKAFNISLKTMNPRWIPRTKASDAELWCFFDLRLNKRLSKQSWGWCFETLSRPLWRHCNVWYVRHLIICSVEWDRSPWTCIFPNSWERPYARPSLNSLRPSNVIWRQGSWSTLAQLMACCLTVPSHYLNQCWQLVSEVSWQQFRRKT